MTEPVATKAQRHPLAVELLVNCADCGRILSAQICNYNGQPFGKQVLITVERCRCEHAAEF